VIGWEGPGLRSLAVEVVFDYDPEAGIGGLVVSALEAMGLKIDGAADAVLAVELAGTPRSGEYGDLGTCYTGAQIRGTLSLTAPAQPPLRFDVEGERGVAPGVIGGNCRRSPEEAPFDWAFEPEFMKAAVGIWGPAAVPYLTTILHRDDYLIRLRTEAVAAYRLLDPASIPVEQQHEFMSAAVWFIGRSLHMSNEGEIATYREATRRLLLTYSETDYGFADQTDVWEWEAWLASWLGSQ
jgi:hypothetical protein